MKTTPLAKARYEAKTLQELEAVAVRFGLSRGWAFHTWSARNNKQQNRSK
jgi:hypothetical protein